MTIEKWIPIFGVVSALQVIGLVAGFAYLFHRLPSECQDLSLTAIPDDRVPEQVFGSAPAGDRTVPLRADQSRMIHDLDGKIEELGREFQAFRRPSTAAAKEENGIDRLDFELRREIDRAARVAVESALSGMTGKAKRSVGDDLASEVRRLFEFEFLDRVKKEVSEDVRLRLEMLKNDIDRKLEDLRRR